jgi:iron-sulfur cluster repair protein YtfE (RIC family)
MTDDPNVRDGRIDPSDSVNDVLRRYPELIGVLNAHGVDTCCGGAQSLTEAASLAGLRLETLIAELTATIAQSTAVKTRS